MYLALEVFNKLGVLTPVKKDTRGSREVDEHEGTAARPRCTDVARWNERTDQSHSHTYMSKHVGLEVRRGRNRSSSSQQLVPCLRLCTPMQLAVREERHGGSPEVNGCGAGVWRRGKGTGEM